MSVGSCHFEGHLFLLNKFHSLFHFIGSAVQFSQDILNLPLLFDKLRRFLLHLLLNSVNKPFSPLELIKTSPIFQLQGIIVLQALLKDVLESLNQIYESAWRYLKMVTGFLGVLLDGSLRIAVHLEGLLDQLLLLGEFLTPSRVCSLTFVAAVELELELADLPEALLWPAVHPDESRAIDDRLVPPHFVLQYRATRCQIQDGFEISFHTVNVFREVGLSEGRGDDLLLLVTELSIRLHGLPDTSEDALQLRTRKQIRKLAIFEQTIQINQYGISCDLPGL